MSIPHRSGPQLGRAERSFWRLRASPELAGAILILILLYFFMALIAPAFITLSNTLNILLQSSIMGIVSIGEAFVMMSAGLDLSVGSVLALSGVVGAAAVGYLGLPWYMGAAASIATGLIVGVINGSLVAIVGLPSFIATLGMLSVASGTALLISNGQVIYGLPHALLYLGQARIGLMPVAVIVFLLVIVIMHGVLQNTPFGRYTLVLGDSEPAAKAVGLSIVKHKIELYALSGLLVGIAGLLTMGRLGASDPTVGGTAVFTAITAVVLGGTDLFGGSGTVVGTVVGTLILGVLSNGLNLMGVSSFYQNIATGAVLIIGVSMSVLRGRISVGAWMQRVLSGGRS